MSLNIGLMIWKEMKTKGISVSVLAEKMAISKSKPRKLSTVSAWMYPCWLKFVRLWAMISLAYYQRGKIFSDYGQQELQKSAEEIKRLKDLLTEKNKAMELKNKMIQNLSHTVSLLEKVQYR